jgi:hypothetical protein
MKRIFTIVLSLIGLTCLLLILPTRKATAQTETIEKEARTTNTCTTSTAGGATCFVRLVWPGTAFPDTNYSVVCMAEGGQPNPPGAFEPNQIYVLPASKRTTGVDVTMQKDTYNAEPVVLQGVNCIAMHD